MNIIRCSIISRRRADGRGLFLRGASAGKGRNISKKEKKNIICLMCVGHMMYMKHMKHMKFGRGFFLTPSTAAGGPPPSKREVLGAAPGKACGLAVDWIYGLCGRPYDPSRALSKILIQLRVQGRNPARFNGGYGVPRGFKGEKSKSPPNPLGLAERVLPKSINKR